MAEPRLELELYIVDKESIESIHYIGMLYEICEKQLNLSDFHIRVFDLRDYPRLAIEKQIVVIPTVIMTSPMSGVRYLGSFENISFSISAVKMQIEAESMRKEAEKMIRDLRKSGRGRQ